MGIDCDVNKRGFRKARVGYVIPESTTEHGDAKPIFTLEGVRKLAARVRAVRERLGAGSEGAPEKSGSSSPGEPGDGAQSAADPPGPYRRPSPPR